MRSPLFALLAAVCLLLCVTACAPVPTPTPPSAAPSASTEPFGPFAPPTPESTPVPDVRNPAGMTLETRFAPPPGFIRTDVEADSFGAYVRSLPLRADGTPVLAYDGTAVPQASAAAVLDVPIGTRNRCQTTDALLLLRGMYLYAENRQSDIVFHFESGFSYDYTTFASGKRVQVDGNTVQWVSREAAGDSESLLAEYLNTLFSYTKASTVERLDTVPCEALFPGAVFVENGGALVADMAVNPDTGETLVLLVRGGSPACDLFVAEPPYDSPDAPWIPVSAGGGIYLGDTAYLAANARAFR